MTHDPQDILARFHRALVREIKSNKPGALTAPFSVAEIYQNLVPYRTHRDEIGVEINGDYEHALLRLLAGQGEFLTIESRTARQEIKEELDSPNPNTALYRDFAAADVLLNPDRIDEALEGWESPEQPPDHEAVDETKASEVAAEGPDAAEAVVHSPGEEGLPEDGPLPEEEITEASEEPPTPSLEVLVEASFPAVSEEVAGEDPRNPSAPAAPGEEASEVAGQEPRDLPEADGAEDTSETAQEEWRDPTTWLEPSIETLREEYERNREASLLQTGEASPGAEEVASEGLPFEVSVRRGEENEMEDSPEEEEGRVEEAAADAVAVDVPENCAWCREKLPDRPGVNFCPFCGMSVKLVPCPECGEELELKWRFCIACGTEVSL